MCFDFCCLINPLWQSSLQSWEGINWGRGKVSQGLRTRKLLVLKSKELLWSCCCSGGVTSLAAPGMFVPCNDLQPP